jgi:hypothetical protein
MGEHFVRGAIMTTHAYVIRAEQAKRLLSERPRFLGMSVDTFFTIINRNDACVHINPLACIQRASPSDGTWDKRDLNKAGWLGKAMIYSALPFPQRLLSFAQFPLLERFKIEQGLIFFRAYRHIMAIKSRRAKPQPSDGNGQVASGSVGEFIEVTLSEESASAH